MSINLHLVFFVYSTVRPFVTSVQHAGAKNIGSMVVFHVRYNYLSGKNMVIIVKNLTVLHDLSLIWKN